MGRVGVYGAVRQVDDLEELDIGIQALAAIPVGAAGEGIGESDVRVNFGGVTFFSGDHLYADNTMILSEDRWISNKPSAIKKAFSMRRPFVYPARNLVQFLRAIQPVVLERTLHVLDGIMMSWCTSFSFWMPTQRPPWPCSSSSIA